MSPDETGSRHAGANWTFPDLLRAAVRVRGGRAALVCDGIETSYAELDRRASQVANGLAGCSVGPRSRVAVLDFNSVRYFELFFGAGKLDAALVGINARLAGPELSYILNDSGAQVLAVSAHHYGLIESIETELKSVGHILALDGGHDRWIDYRSWRDGQAAGDPCLPVNPDSDCILLYTSGTTGQPKGVCHTHRTWRAWYSARRAAGAWAVTSTDTRMLACAPVFHVAGFNQVAHTLSGGGMAVLTKKAEPAEICRAIEKHRITDILLVPTMIREVVLHSERASIDVSSVRTIVYGAAPMPLELLERAREVFKCSFIHAYGQTENLGGSTFLAPEMHDARLGKLGSCGKPYPGLELRIIGKDGSALGPEQVGEIAVRCPWLMRGYWRNAAETAAAVRQGWLFSGDAGYLDAEGFLHICDRIKDMIITGGENVFPAEIEQVLLSHPAVADAAVVGVPHPKWGEAIKAFIVPKSAPPPGNGDLLAFVRERLAGYKVPKSIEYIDQIPRNAAGKVLRHALRTTTARSG